MHSGTGTAGLDPGAEPQLSRRDAFLIAMYSQLMGDINRHITIIWQSVATLVAAGAVFGLAGQDVIPLGLATAIIIATSVWSVAHCLDSNYWYNRNLSIIANIERQFLAQSDLKEIHYYFGEHRPTQSILTHLRIQMFFAAFIATAVLLYYYTNELTEQGLMHALPASAYFFGACAFFALDRYYERKYAAFLRNSPGKPVDASGIDYSIGHGSPRSGPRKL